MGSYVSWVIELALKPGKLDDFKALMDEMVESTQAEPGTLGYEWFFSDDGSACHIYERYADSKAMLSHVGGFQEKFAARFLDMADVTRFVVYGSPSDEARKVLDGFGASYMAQLGGFAR